MMTPADGTGDWRPIRPTRPLDDDERAAAAAALAPVLADLRATAGPALEVRYESSEPPDPDSVQAGLAGADGRVHMAIWVSLTSPPAERAERAADQVQEWAVEELWDQGRSAVWPQCPDHPDSHPLELLAANGDDQARWRCPRSGRVIGALGKLGRPA